MPRFQIRVNYTRGTLDEWIVAQTCSKKNAILWKDRLNEAFIRTQDDNLRARIVKLRKKAKKKGKVKARG